MDNMKVVMEGSWIYGGIATHTLQIVISDVLYGSGDYEDPPEIRDDKKIECYYIEFLSTHKDKVDSMRGGFLTLAEAIDEAEEITNQKIKWRKI
jgi:hypothetical protein